MAGRGSKQDFATALAVVMGRCGTNEPSWLTGLQPSLALGEGSSFNGWWSSNTPHLVGWGLSTPPWKGPANAFLFLVSNWGTGPQKLFII